MSYTPIAPLTIAPGQDNIQEGFQKYEQERDNIYTALNTINTAVATKSPIANPTFTGVVTTAGQVKFPAAQSAASDPNTLDDYEEGTWSPVLRGSSVAGTYTGNFSNANYVKVGRMVTATVSANLTAASGGSGYAQLTGLPFAPVSDVIGTVLLGNVDLTSVTKYVVTRNITAGSTTLYFPENQDNGALLDLPISSFVVGSTIGLSVSYIANA